MWFRELVQPMTPEAFLAQVKTRTWCRFPGSPGRFTSLFNLGALQEWLNATRWDPERIFLIESGRRFDPSTYLSNPKSPRGWRPIGAAVQRLLCEGATLVVNAVDEIPSGLAKLAEELEDLFDVTVGVNLYATRGGKQAFDAHWDDHDVFVIQLAGRKHWQVWRPTVLHPLVIAPKQIPPPQDDVWNGEIVDGDVLYLPRGWWHRAQGVGDESVHLAVGIQESTGHDLVSLVIKRLLESSTFRAPLPRDPDSPDATAWQETARQEWINAWTPDVLQEFRERESRKAFARPCLDLPFGNGVPRRGDVEHRVRLARARRIMMRPRDDRYVDLLVGSTAIRATPELADVLRPLRHTVFTSVATLVSEARQRRCEPELSRTLELLRQADQLEYVSA